MWASVCGAQLAQLRPVPHGNAQNLLRGLLLEQAVWLHLPSVSCQRPGATETMAVYPGHGPEHPGPRRQQDLRVPETLPAGRLPRNGLLCETPRPLAQNHRGPDRMRRRPVRRSIQAQGGEFPRSPRWTGCWKTATSRWAGVGPPFDGDVDIWGEFRCLCFNSNIYSVLKSLEKYYFSISFCELGELCKNTFDWKKFSISWHHTWFHLLKGDQCIERTWVFDNTYLSSYLLLMDINFMLAEMQQSVCFWASADFWFSFRSDLLSLGLTDSNFESKHNKTLKREKQRLTDSFIGGRRKNTTEKCCILIVRGPTLAYYINIIYIYKETIHFLLL